MKVVPYIGIQVPRYVPYLPLDIENWLFTEEFSTKLHATRNYQKVGLHSQYTKWRKKAHVHITFCSISGEIFCHLCCTNRFSLLFHFTFLPIIINIIASNIAPCTNRLFVASQVYQQYNELPFEHYHPRTCGGCLSRCNCVCDFLSNIFQEWSNFHCQCQDHYFPNEIP